MKKWVKTASYELALCIALALVAAMFGVFAPLGVKAVLAGSFGTLSAVALVWALLTKPDPEAEWFWEDKLFRAIGNYIAILSLPAIVGIIFFLLLILLW